MKYIPNPFNAKTILELICSGTVTLDLSQRRISKN